MMAAPRLLSVIVPVFNGSDREAYVTNDSEKLTTIANCGLMPNQTTAGPAGCTTVASDMSSAECGGDAYYTYTLHDGSGQEHSLVAQAGQSVDLGASVTGVTLSTEQLAWAQQRVTAAGLGARCDLRLQDYRDLAPARADERFDAIVSIEMFEAVGREYWGRYFETLRRCLKPGGRACIQSITIRDDLFPRYLRSTDFIQQYIFPGGLLPSPSEFRKAARAAGLEVVNELAFGADYAETLVRWRERFLAEEPRVRALGFDTRFMRTWEFYLAYCEAAFACGNTDVMQFTLRRA